MILATLVKSSILAMPWVAKGIKRMVRSQAFTKLQAYQRWTLRKAAALDAQLPDIKPEIHIETNAGCNACCRMCVHSQHDLRGEMRMELYEKLIREVAGWGIPHVNLTGCGEPFADPHWLKRIEVLRGAGLHYEFVSNASLMNPQVLERMFELGGWDVVTFSVNGYSAAAYERMMPPLKRELVYDKIDGFLKMREQRGLSWPQVMVSCVQSRLNMHEVNEFRRYWRSQRGVSRVLTPECGTWNGQVIDPELTIPGQQRQVAKDGWLSPCPMPWRMMSVLCDGRVVPCKEECGSRRLIVGDAKRNTLQEVFQSEPMRSLRACHLANQRCSHGLCSACGLNIWWV